MVRATNNRAWLLVLPALVLIIASAGLPLMAVINYAFQDVFPGDNYFWVGTTWFQELLNSSQFRWALARSLLFCLLVLAIELPLGIFIALRMPGKSRLAGFYIILMCIPLLTPWMVVGLVWKLLINVETGLLGSALAAIGLVYNLENPVVAWATIIAMDVWHWTSLIVLLCYAGLMSIPDDYYRAARIDGASKWSIFRYIQLPKLRRVLLIAILLRFMDSFMVYAEPFVVTRGGPGTATTFLSVELVQTALKQFDLGRASAMGVIYFLIMLAVSWSLFKVMMKPAD